MGLDPATGKSKGYCFLDFTDRASAEAALSMDGFDLAGRKVETIKIIISARLLASY